LGCRALELRIEGLEFRAMCLWLSTEGLGGRDIAIKVMVQDQSLW
jgi:hypothetical protein